ncbi:MAG: hypothetical protein QOC56_1438, partial [Alphaproteobacteria bacterium]|nr:hypothetical protein [Alphaproteobacteria bacterium]
RAAARSIPDGDFRTAKAAAARRSPREIDLAAARASFAEMLAGDRPAGARVATS